MSVVGIDIGNENTVVALVRRGGVDVCANEVSKRETAYVCSFHLVFRSVTVGNSTLVGFSNKLRQLGEAAASMVCIPIAPCVSNIVQHASNLKNTAANFKQLIGREMDGSADMQRELGFNYCETVKTREGQVGYKVRFCEHLMRSHSLHAGELLRRAACFLGASDHGNVSVSMSTDR